MTMELELAVRVAVEKAVSCSTTSKRADAWREEIGALEFLPKAVRFGIQDMAEV